VPRKENMMIVFVLWLLLGASFIKPLHQLGIHKH
jgi:hypothetical protein